MPKLSASTAALSVLALAGLVFAAAIVQDRFGKDGPPASPKAKPSPKAPAFPGKGGIATSGPSLADMIKVASAGKSQPAGGASATANLPEVPAILKQIHLSPMISSGRITGWCVESMGMAGVVDREKAVPTQSLCPKLTPESVDTFAWGE